MKDLFLSYGFYIEEENENTAFIVSRREIGIDILMYIGACLGKTAEPREINSGKVDEYFKKVLFADESAACFLAREMGGHGASGTADSINIDFNDAPIIKLVNSILEEAVKTGASDIHIEPQENNVRCRMRIDGNLLPVLDFSSGFLDAVSGRVKYLAHLDMTRKNIPQDGKVRIHAGKSILDLRVSIIPARRGESIVIRILNRDYSFIDLAKIGFDSATEEKIRKIIRARSGLVLVTGPTGNGKSTTLYAMIKELNSNEVNILTVEDPVEYEIPGISQVEINTQQGLTFPRALRHFLRHDPDIIMVGEIRDEETARIAIQSSLTGHLVLSTLHTNDAVSAVTRLLDLGIEPYLISSSLRGVIAQRLVRRLCGHCREKIPPDRQYLELLKTAGMKSSRMYSEKGCSQCRSGYSGRLAVFEFLEITPSISAAIGAAQPEKAILQAAGSFRTIFTDILEKISNGETSFSEAQKIIFGG